MLKTEFWRRAAAALPAHARVRYALELQGAERIDVAVQKLVDTCRAGRRALRRSRHAPTLKPGVQH